MSPARKQLLSVALVTAIAGAASAFAVVEWRVGTLESTVERIDQRVSEIYCATVPATLRAGCR